MIRSGIADASQGALRLLRSTVHIRGTTSGAMAHVWINGRFEPDETAGIPLRDTGLLHAAGVFTTMRSYGGRVFRLDAAPRVGCATRARRCSSRCSTRTTC